MYPLKLCPPVKDYLWGGTRLKEEYGYKSDKPVAAEAWVLSNHKDGTNTVLNGEYAGKTLDKILALWGEEALGKNAARFPYFPLLIKLIDAKDRLSVQVHPDDEYALENEGEFGKTEMWYVVDCDEGAELIYGFKEDITTEEFRRRIEDNTLTDVCNAVPVHKGDVFFIAAGTLHAIGKGILIAEVQQNSNTTYRVSDYGRLGADGKPRALHTEKALEVTKTQKPVIPYGNTGEVNHTSYGDVRELAKCDFFTAKLVSLNGKGEFLNNDSFVSLLALDGNAVLTAGDDIMNIKKGDSIFVPAGVEFTLDGNGEILLSSV